MAVPNNISTFFQTPDVSKIYQGDILAANAIGLKQEGESLSPNFWMVITKSCDLVIQEKDGQVNTRKGSIKVLPVISLKILNFLHLRDTIATLERTQSKVVLLAILPFVKAFAGMKADSVDQLIKNEMSRYLYLPPDGSVFNEPMIVDFDLNETLNGRDDSELRKALEAKVLQLATPFREKVAQRFANHYSAIGIDDDEIKTKSYVASLKKSLTDYKEKQTPST